MLFHHQRRAHTSPSTPAATLIGPSQAGLTPKNFLVPAVLCAALAVSTLAVPAHARSKKSAPKATGVWAWTSGSKTYLRSRPGVQTPPVAKVPTHTKLFVWGKYNGWYRVETPDGKFGWVHNEYLNSSDLEKAPLMSHFAAKKASDRTENQLMYGSVELLRRHYERYGSLGAKKGLLDMGVQLPATRTAALPKSVETKPVQVKPVVVKPVVVKLVVAARLIAEAKPVAAKPLPKTSLPKAPTKIATKPNPVVPVAAPVAVPAPIPIAATVVTPTATLAPSNFPSPTLGGPVVAPPVASSVAPKVALPKVRPATKPVELSPAIPLSPVVPPTARAAKPKKLSPITAEDVLAARDEYLRSRTGASAPTPSPLIETDRPLFQPMSYSPSALPRQQFSPREEPVSQPEFVEAVRPRVAAFVPTAKPVLMAKNISRGGSPRDLVKAAPKATLFGQKLASSALSYRGRPYVRGAASGRAFDCSGLVYFLMRKRGITPPRTAAGLASFGKPVKMGQLKAGDLVLFANTYKRGVSHVGVYLGSNNFVHASTSGSGVRVDSLGSSYYARKYWGARRAQ